MLLDDWLNVNVTRTRNFWLAVAYVEMPRADDTHYFLQFTAQGKDPDEAVAYLERAIVQEIGHKVRQGPGRRAYDKDPLWPTTPWEELTRRRS